MRDLLTALSKSRAQQGFAPTETALFVFSLKQPMFEHLSGSGEAGNDVLDRVWRLNRLLDDLGLYTTEMYQRGRESIIQKQQQELLDLSTPVVKLYEQILALPLIGTLDSERTQVVMENLLDGIIAHEARIAIIDITGVPAVDTLVAQHLMKTIAAARLMGAECILSGIRPQIAQTIVHLGVDLGDIMTKATLADALVMALQRTGHVVVRKQG
ncbi:rsbT co-antagonist protein RsbR [Gulbenkiania mobilis]|uniref:RsbT co-antagonist protein RsbR n=2 Tax=Gulbenkiania mobilis TaxID=397457 RepID=A0ABY2D075_GULMO|nr:rsbT co-antagonist protein RsbR [Gulbenkiania mobilis]